MIRRRFIHLYFISGSSHLKNLNSYEKIFCRGCIIYQQSRIVATRQLAKSLDQVVITATKFPEKQSNTGKVVTIVTREQIDRSSGKDLAQVLNEQTGIIVSGANSNPGKDKSLFLKRCK